ncbi:helix-turn-helix domain-containing protein [Saccharomonospora glauca]|jgi:AraC-like DNA-binding protein|uniref:DNA-binding domain-containing protein, AraC-type n=1 Tax=Saccharomonospora glauca K62 TaxID=928724 RepID=I1D0T9_9PSEU|nr:helix-turn-helix domain-containing protein [Saccharomonospora glauca]EIE98563.1 DNA-binding domain-containing protein, AraC-type [Saccharomonospora glauca K62]
MTDLILGPEHTRPGDLIAPDVATSPAMEVDAHHLTADLHLRQRNLPLDAMRVWTMSFAPMRFRRTAKHIAQADPETYNVVLLREGTLRRVDDHTDVTYEPGDVHVIDSSLPFRLEGHGPPPISCVGVEVPKVMLPLPDGHSRSLVGRRLPAREGMGGLLTTVLDHIITDHGSYRDTDEPRVATVLRDVLAGLITQALEDEKRHVPPEVHRRNLLLRMRAFIDQHLHNRDLGPQLIADAHHVSTSYVHRLFGEDGTTVSAWIRQRRLERARRDLADPAMHAVPVHHIAARWGFSHHAAFTRAFRTAYGIAPRDLREKTRPRRVWRERQEIEEAAPMTSPAFSNSMMSRR